MKISSYLFPHPHPQQSCRRARYTNCILRAFLEFVDVPIKTNKPHFANLSKTPRCKFLLAFYQCVLGHDVSLHMQAIHCFCVNVGGEDDGKYLCAFVRI